MTKLEKAKAALIDWLNGEVDHIQLVRTEDGHEHVHRWTRDNPSKDDADRS
jgi:hypothetical protein